ncbi:hypothetical protein CYMTET_31712 [Cymbomonas tetramitiformis]|uniref:Uncharacterized protein n=1 Tax=Cymbomonas tetramitiformis TaxID=36881 RepID=A0AAE0FGG2_9CHLO|nr:hypothetical protein CYMTET_31712 [Cymbomonas tetramitiformis]
MEVAEDEINFNGPTSSVGNGSSNGNGVSLGHAVNKNTNRVGLISEHPASYPERAGSIGSIDTVWSESESSCDSPRKGATFLPDGTASDTGTSRQGDEQPGAFEEPATANPSAITSNEEFGAFGTTVAATPTVNTSAEEFGAFGEPATATYITARSFRRLGSGGCYPPRQHGAEDFGRLGGGDCYPYTASNGAEELWERLRGAGHERGGLWGVWGAGNCYPYRRHERGGLWGVWRAGNCYPYRQHERGGLWGVWGAGGCYPYRQPYGAEDFGAFGELATATPLLASTGAEGTSRRLGAV